MSRTMTRALIALFAVTALSACVSANASAFHPLFFNQGNKPLLLFSGLAKTPVLRAKRLSTLSSVTCEHALIHGFALHLSTLAHRVLLEFLGKCNLTSPIEKAACNEPITTKFLLAELGLSSATNKTVVILLAPSDGTTIFLSMTCGSFNVFIEGTLVGEIPERNALNELQINVPRNEIEVVFAVLETGQQAITEIFLLGTNMTGQELKVTGSFGEFASLEAKANLKGDGTIEISTTKI